MLNRTKREAARDTGYPTVLFVMRCHRTLTCVMLTILFIHLFIFLLVVLGLGVVHRLLPHMQAFSGGSERGYSSLRCLGLSLCMPLLRSMACSRMRFSSCCTWIKYSPTTCRPVPQSRDGIVSSVLAGRSLTAGPPGKSLNICF